jgi:hypothetical protein
MKNNLPILFSLPLLCFSFIGKSQEENDSLIKWNRVKSKTLFEYLTIKGKTLGPFKKEYTEYDQEGRKVLYKDWDFDSTLISTYSYFYDSTGRLAMVEVYSEALTARYSRKEKCIYDENGILIAKENFSLDSNKLKETVKYTYGQNQKVVEVFKGETIGKPVTKVFFDYDTSGFLIQTISYDYREGDKPDIKITFTNDSIGNKTSETLYMHNMEKQKYRIDYFYNDKGLVTTSTYSEKKRKPVLGTKIEYEYY